MSKTIYHRKDFFYEDDNDNFYDSEIQGFNDYPPDLVDLVGYGLSEINMFDELGSTQLNSGYERLVQSMRIILSTPVGTRFFLPTFGSKIHELLFQPNDYIFKDLLKSYIKDSINKWEPRVIIDDIIVGDVNKANVPVEIHFHSIYSSSSDSFVYTINRELKDLD